MTTRFLTGAQQCAEDDRFTADVFMRDYYKQEIADTELLEDLRDICVDCPFRVRCNEWAVAHERYGFWAGKSPLERTTERQARGIHLAEPMIGLVVMEVVA